MLHADEGAAQVDVENAVPFVQLDLGDRRRLVLDASVVEGDVEPAERLDSARHRRLDLLRLRYVAGNDKHIATRVPDGIGGVAQRIVGTVKNGDASAFGGERDGRGASYATGRAGDESDFTIEAIGKRHGAPC